MKFTDSDDLPATGALRKPFRPHELVAKVDAVLRAHLVPGPTPSLLVPA